MKGVRDGQRYPSISGNPAAHAVKRSLANPMTSPGTQHCALCGLSLRYGSVDATIGGQKLRFCCSGCRMVYAMLLEAADSPDPARFKESELYRRCVDAGVVPATEADLAAPDRRSGQRGAVAAEIQTDDRNLVLNFKVAGMWCSACSWVIENALSHLPGLSTVACDFATDRLRCTYDPTRTDPAGIETAIRDLGYEPLPLDGDVHKVRLRNAFIRLMICALLAVNVMMLSWALYSGFFTSLSGDDIRYISWPIVAMATAVMVYGGGPLFRRAWWGVRAGSPGMETLVCLGAGSAYLYSLYNFGSGSWHLYFDTAAMLITLVLLGKMLEERAKAGVRRDLEGFLALQPNKVRLCSERFPGGRFADIGQLVQGDAFRVQAEEIVPADGRILEGTGWVDEAAVTGESRPRAVGPDGTVTSGTRLLSGDITVTALRVGRQAVLGQMIEIIEAGLARRTPLESRTDRWLAVFVPVMVSLAATAVLATHAWGLTWEHALVRGITVLVIACPCALGIAVPLARTAGMSQAGRRGILVRDFEAFERNCTIDTVLFDKTGTLTRGHWSLERVEVFGGMGAEEATALAAGLEANADHVIARAVTAYARKRGIEPALVEGIRIDARGVSGMARGAEVRIGSRDFVGRDDSPDPAVAAAGPSYSRIFLSRNLEVCAVLWFGDQVRKSAGPLIRRLRDDGYVIHLISGDGQDAAAAVAAHLGIANARGDLSPQDKAGFVAGLQQKGRRVAMVGDGINDAPALAMADLSVAVHRDAALTQQAADLTLMRGDPGQLLDFLALAKRVNAKVTQNLGCAWVYNLIGIPIAMSGWLNPLVAVTAMLLSSLTVIGNTLLLVKKGSME
jgi:heavy metal translocating P-type ATPase